MCIQCIVQMLYRVAWALSSFWWILLCQALASTCWTQKPRLRCFDWHQQMKTHLSIAPMRHQEINHCQPYNVLLVRFNSLDNHCVWWVDFNSILIPRGWEQLCSKLIQQQSLTIHRILHCGIPPQAPLCSTPALHISPKLFWRANNDRQPCGRA